MTEVKKRDQVEQKYTWALQDLYQTEEQWRIDAGLVRKMSEELQKCRGKLENSAQELLSGLLLYRDMNLTFEKVYVYANQLLHQDMGNSKSQELAGEAQVLMNEINCAAAFFEPEILGISEETLVVFRREEPEIAEFDRYLAEILRRKEHSLGEEKEEMLAKVHRLGQAPANIYGMFNNTDIRFQAVTDAKGKQQPLTQGRYGSFLEHTDRSVRRQAFENLYAGYRGFVNTLAAVYDANVRQAAFFAEERGYESTLHAALDEGNIPVSVYENLVDSVEGHLTPLHRYLELRRRVLKLEELHMYDVYVPVVDEVSRSIPFEEAKQMVKNGLAPLGEEYLDLLQEGFDNRWIDVYENEGKRTGAYSWGAYGTHPYVLLNYQGNLNQVFTLAHEMGHALHSWYSDHSQNYLNAGYHIFVAEVASTCNEALLIHYLMDHTEDVKEKAYLISYFLEQFRTTLYRQTMFAHFEKDMHRLVEQGKTLTAELLCDAYYALNRLYFGDGVVSDDAIRYEWARIPHFYTPFYVYQYATGFSAAIAISSKILAGEPGMVEKYKRFLSGGCSMDPIDLLNICGVDMTGQEPVENALQVFEHYVEELEKLIAL